MNSPGHSRILHTTVLTCTAACLVGLPFAPWASSGGDDESTRIKQLHKQSLTARKERDYETFREATRGLLDLLPNHQTLVYHLAQANARLGQHDTALSWLERYANMGLTADVETDSAFAELLDDPDFLAVSERLAANRQPVGGGLIAFQLDEPDFIPEGIAYDPASESFFLGSIHLRKIVKATRPAKIASIPGWQVELFADSEGDGLWSVLGMSIDSARRRLWVCSAALSEARGCSEAEEGRAAVFLYDLESGQLQKKFLAIPDPELLDPTHYLFGDLAVSSRGDVYISDTLGRGIHIIIEGADSLATFLPLESFPSPQGLTFGKDESALFLADYGRGVYRIDLQSRNAELLPHPTNTTLYGIDGLYYHAGALIAVQNGVQPHRILRLQLDGDEKHVTDWDVIAANQPEWDEPTLGVIVDEVFYYVANSQWSSFDWKGNLLTDYQRKGPIIMMEVLGTTEQKR